MYRSSTCIFCVARACCGLQIIRSFLLRFSRVLFFHICVAIFCLFVRAPLMLDIKLPSVILWNIYSKLLKRSIVKCRNHINGLILEMILLFLLPVGIVEKTVTSSVPVQNKEMNFCHKVLIKISVHQTTMINIHQTTAATMNFGLYSQRMDALKN